MDELRDANKEWAKTVDFGNGPGVNLNPLQTADVDLTAEVRREHVSCEDHCSPHECTLCWSPWPCLTIQMSKPEWRIACLSTASASSSWWHWHLPAETKEGK